jgi:hypothetical protein
MHRTCTNQLHRATPADSNTTVLVSPLTCVSTLVIHCSFRPAIYCPYMLFQKARNKTCVTGKFWLQMWLRINKLALRELIAAELFYEVPSYSSNEVPAFHSIRYFNYSLSSPIRDKFIPSRAITLIYILLLSYYYYYSALNMLIL